jgi:hypothetical protein
MIQPQSGIVTSIIIRSAENQGALFPQIISLLANQQARPADEIVTSTSRIFGPHQRAGDIRGDPGHSYLTPATRTLDGDATWHLESCGTQEDRQRRHIPSQKPIESASSHSTK